MNNLSMALKNLKKNFSFYALYLLSVSFVITVFFAFTSFSMNTIMLEKISVMKLKTIYHMSKLVSIRLFSSCKMTSKHSLQNWFRKPRITTNPFRKFRLLYPKLQKSLKPLSTQYKIFKTRSMLFQMFLIPTISAVRIS